MFSRTIPRRAIIVTAAAILCLPWTVTAQSISLPPLSRVALGLPVGPTLHVSLRGASGPALFRLPSDSTTVAAPARRVTAVVLDSVAIKRTHWVRGGAMGAATLGLAGYVLSGLCDADSGGNCGQVRLSLTFMGTALGFVLGALIGGQFPAQ